jgi:catechol 2,3-dioxygenase-like lactoylglutathione lyase family enzyme
MRLKHHNAAKPYGQPDAPVQVFSLASVGAARRYVQADADSGRGAARSPRAVRYLRSSGRRRNPVKRTWAIIGVRNVASSFNWYQSLFGQPETPPAHADFGQILDADGTVLLCLHEWGAHEHPSLMSPDHATPGNGLLLFFRVDDFDTALRRARALVTRLDEEPHVNPNTGTNEFALRDPDGYYVTINAFSAA